jgi:cytochrome c oxidase subunit 2
LPYGKLISMLLELKKVLIVAKGETVWSLHIWLLLCNKICGASHYNMQMKIIVDTLKITKHG